ncbi:hypothetical protein J8273_8048, partial [Carpediemonas membranifera]
MPQPPRRVFVTQGNRKQTRAGANMTSRKDKNHSLEAAFALCFDALQGDVPLVPNGTKWEKILAAALSYAYMATTELSSLLDTLRLLHKTPFIAADCQFQARIAHLLTVFSTVDAPNPVPLPRCPTAPPELVTRILTRYSEVEQDAMMASAARRSTDKRTGMRLWVSCAVAAQALTLAGKDGLGLFFNSDPTKSVKQKYVIDTLHTRLAIFLKTGQRSTRRNAGHLELRPSVDTGGAHDPGNRGRPASFIKLVIPSIREADSVTMSESAMQGQAVDTVSAGPHVDTPLTGGGVDLDHWAMERGQQQLTLTASKQPQGFTNAMDLSMAGIDRKFVVEWPANQNGSHLISHKDTQYCGLRSTSTLPSPLLAHEINVSICRSAYKYCALEAIQGYIYRAGARCNSVKYHRVHSA